LTDIDRKKKETQAPEMDINWEKRDTGIRNGYELGKKDTGIRDGYELRKKRHRHQGRI
jgi:hypothetical protein